MRYFLQRPALSITGIVALVSLLILCFISHIAYKQYTETLDRTIENKYAENERLIQILSDHIELTLHMIDTMLQETIDESGQLIPNKPLAAAINNSPSIAGIITSDNKGNILKTDANTMYGTQAITTIFAPHAPLIAEHSRIFSPRGVALALHDINIDTTSRYIVMNRVFFDADKRYAGNVSALIDSNYINRFLDSIKLGENSNISLIFEDSSSLLTGKTTIEERKFLKETIFAHYTASGPYHIQSTKQVLRDNKLRLLSFTQLNNLPLNLAIMLHEDDILAKAHSELKRYLQFIGLFAAFALFACISTYIISRNSARARASEEKALLASQTKSEFLARMSHEFRTPLNAIIGFSDILSSEYFGTLNDKQKERVSDIHDCGNQLLAIIVDILEFSKGEAGKLTLCEENISIYQSVNNVIRMIEVEANYKHLTISTSIPAPFSLLGDSRKIRQILLNLLSNAVRFTPEHGKIDISARLDKDNNCVITITDTGVGIAPSDIPQALSVFGQTHRSLETTEHQYQGTGLGLPLAKMLTQLHNGKLKLESDGKTGTKVTVTLPAKRVILQENSAKERATNNAPIAELAYSL